MRRNRMIPLVLFAGLGLGAAAWMWAAGLEAGAPGSPPPGAHVPSKVPVTKRAPGETLPPPARHPLEAGSSLAVEPWFEAGPAPNDDALRMQLRRVATVDTADLEAFERVVRPLLNPASMARVVFLLQGRGLAREEARLSAEEIGALRSIGAACIVFSSVRRPPGLAVDGRAFVISVLEALADVAPPAQGILAGLLGASRQENGALVLDLSYAPELDRLAALHPDQSELYLSLLAEASGDLDPPGGRALDLLHITDERSPALVNAALARFLGSDEFPAALQWAAALHDREDVDPALRRAVTTAVAAAAPVSQATDFLSERADERLLVEFDMLGERAGGLEALEEEYYTLRVRDGADDTARTMLVAGMGAAETSELLAIALDDPSPRVRGQAWTTLTVAAEFEPTRDTVELLRECFLNRGDGDAGVPTYAVITAAANAATRADGRPAVLGEVTRLLREIAEDPGVPERDRHKAIEKLARYVSPSEVARLRALVNP